MQQINSSSLSQLFEPYYAHLEDLNHILQWVWDLRKGHEEAMASPLFPVVLSIGFYVLCVLPLTLLDVFGGVDWPWYSKYKLQTGRPTTWPMVRRALIYVSTNNVLFILPVSIAQYIWVPATAIPPNAPTLTEVAGQMLVLLVIFDFQYGVWHVIHHKNRWLYKTFHSIHHQYHSTFALVGQFLHPWELFTIAFFTTVDPWMFQCHPLTVWIWMLTNIWLATEAHSGLDLPLGADKLIPFGLMGGSRKHDMHHMRPLTNFQPYLCTWDRLFDWECPGMVAGGRKPSALVQWEEKHKQERMARHATQMMHGQVNGFLTAEENPKEK